MSTTYETAAANKTTTRAAHSNATTAAPAHLSPGWRNHQHGLQRDKCQQPSHAKIIALFGGTDGTLAPALRLRLWLALRSWFCWVLRRLCLRLCRCSGCLGGSRSRRSRRRFFGAFLLRAFSSVSCRRRARGCSRSCSGCLCGPSTLGRRRRRWRRWRRSERLQELQSLCP